MIDFADFNLIGNSAALRSSLKVLEHYARHDAAVLILGESGTGKEAAARAIHHLSKRSDQIFVTVNCGAVPDHLVESEFFGHVKGAFTDAREARQGLAMSASGGTLFLDEIEAMPLRAQGALLRFLQHKEFRPVGGETVKTADIRIVAASNANLFEMAQAGLFRFDLLQRLNVLTFHLPPLRERREDIGLLAQLFVDRHNKETAGQTKSLHPDSLALLHSHSWPGNVRELENLIQREFLVAEGDLIRITTLQPKPWAACQARASIPDQKQSSGADSANHEIRFNRRAEGLGTSVASPSSAHEPLDFDVEHGLREKLREAMARPYDEFRSTRDEIFDLIEKGYLKALLARANGNLSLAARIAGKDRGNLYKLLKRYGLELRTAEQA